MQTAEEQAGGGQEFDPKKELGGMKGERDPFWEDLTPWKQGVNVISLPVIKWERKKDKFKNDPNAKASWKVKITVAEGKFKLSASRAEDLLKLQEAGRKKAQVIKSGEGLKTTYTVSAMPGE